MNDLNTKHSTPRFSWFAKLLAFLFPIYYVFMPIKDNTKESETIWKYIIAGFVFYTIILTILLLSF